MKIAIIGAGASGLFLASYLSKSNKNIDITIYERNNSIGRKILASGNGKCNFMNYKAMPYDYNNQEFMANIFKKCPVDIILNYFQDLGLMFKFDEEGRMYPISESSETILKILTSDLKNTIFKLGEVVSSIKYNKNNVTINNSCIYDYVILASGSNASIDSKKRQSTYGYLKDLNLKITDLKPSLVGFKIKEDIKMLSGLRMKAMVTLSLKDKRISREAGEIIFKDDGISGICVMNLSRFYEKGLDFKLNINFLINKEEALFSIKKRKTINDNPEYYLEGIFHPKMIKYIVKHNLFTIEKLTDLLNGFTLSIKDTYDLTFSQVVRGGIDLSEIDDNFNLKKYPKIYTMGEMLDIDGKCGGYNLLFAFTSALIVGRSLEEKYEISNN